MPSLEPVPRGGANEVRLSEILRGGAELRSQLDVPWLTKLVPTWPNSSGGVSRNRSAPRRNYNPGTTGGITGRVGAIRTRRSLANVSHGARDFPFPRSFDFLRAPCSRKRSLVRKYLVACIMHGAGAISAHRRRAPPTLIAPRGLMHLLDARGALRDRSGRVSRGRPCGRRGNRIGLTMEQGNRGKSISVGQIERKCDSGCGSGETAKGRSLISIFTSGQVPPVFNYHRL